MGSFLFIPRLLLAKTSSHSSIGSNKSQRTVFFVGVALLIHTENMYHHYYPTAHWMAFFGDLLTHVSNVREKRNCTGFVGNMYHKFSVCTSKITHLTRGLEVNVDRIAESIICVVK